LYQPNVGCVSYTQPIFSSDTGMSGYHHKYRRQNLSVNTDDFTLTILNLRLDSGAGKYICSSEVEGSRNNKRIYNVVVRGIIVNSAG